MHRPLKQFALKALTPADAEVAPTPALESGSLEEDQATLESLFNELSEECQALESLDAASRLLADQPDLAPTVESMVDTFMAENEITPALEADVGGKIKEVAKAVWKKLLELWNKIVEIVKKYFDRASKSIQGLLRKHKEQKAKLIGEYRKGDKELHFKIPESAARMFNGIPFQYMPHLSREAAKSTDLAGAVHYMGNTFGSMPWKGADAAATGRALNPVIHVLARDYSGTPHALEYNRFAVKLSTMYVEPGDNRIELLKEFEDSMKLEVEFDDKELETEVTINASRLWNVMNAFERFAKQYENSLAHDDDMIQGGLDRIKQAIVKCEALGEEEEVKWHVLLACALRIAQKFVRASNTVLFYEHRYLDASSTWIDAALKAI